MTQNEFDCIVIGSGPGGYVAAIRAAQKGLSTALIENTQTGGTCLNRGCIPSKALIASGSLLKKIKHADKYGIHIKDYSFDYTNMFDRKAKVVSNLRKGLEGLLKANNVRCFQGLGKLTSDNEVKVMGQDSVMLRGTNIILATGAEPATLFGTPYSSNILNSTGILEMPKLPQSLAIIGGGVIGCEFASLFANLGVKITVFESSPRILSIENEDIGSFLTSSFKNRGISLLTNTQISGLEDLGDCAEVVVRDGERHRYDKILIAVGRKPNTSDLGLEKAGVIVNERGMIPTDEYLRTNIPNIYAIGDITGKWLLAHVASHQGIIAVENITGHSVKMDYSAIPGVIFTDPESASVGLSLEKAQQQGIPALKSTFPFRALGKALAIDEHEGFATIISHKETKQILGAYVVGPHASSLIGEMTLAVKNELTLPCIYETIHAHPTLSEIWVEACLLADDQPLHIPRKP